MQKDKWQWLTYDRDGWCTWTDMPTYSKWKLWEDGTEVNLSPVDTMDTRGLEHSECIWQRDGNEWILCEKPQERKEQ